MLHENGRWCFSAPTFSLALQWTPSVRVQDTNGGFRRKEFGFLMTITHPDCNRTTHRRGGTVSVLCWEDPVSET